MRPRLIHYLLALPLLMLSLTLRSGIANAQVNTCNTNAESGNCADEGSALIGATGAAAAYTSVASRNRTACPPITYKSGASWSVWVYLTPTHAPKCDGGASTPSFVRYFNANATCDKRPSKVTPFFPPSGSVRCMDGCESTFRNNADDTSTYSPTGKTCEKKPDCAAQGRNMVWNAVLGVCQPVAPECPQGQVKVGNACTDEKPCPDGMALVNGSCKKKDEECPAGMMRSPLGSCIPGDGTCAAGEVRGKDGTCKKDKDGDGKPDPGEEGGEDSDGKRRDEFAGGDDCKNPPSCSGSPIMCGQARIQWRIDCNTRRNNNISGGQCTQAGTPVCTGETCNAMEYTQLLMQWRSACAIEKLASKGAETPVGSSTDANGNGVADVLEGQGTVTSPGDGTSDIASAKKWGIGVSTNMIDTSSLFGTGGSCPQPPSITIMGTTVSGADFPYFCQLAAIMRGLILLFGAYFALRILLGGSI